MLYSLEVDTESRTVVEVASIKRASGMHGSASKFPKFFDPTGKLRAGIPKQSTY